MYSSFMLSTLIVPTLGPLRVPPPGKLYTRTTDQNVTSLTSTHHSTGQSALHKFVVALGIIKSLVSPINGPLVCAPFTLILT